MRSERRGGIRAWVCGLVCGWAAVCVGGNFVPSARGEDTAIQRIAFGSCADQNNPCPVWGTIAEYRPDLLVLLGDNVYADLEDGRLKPSTPERIAAAYRQLDAVPAFHQLKQQVPILATWDDHDYGNNDAGVEWEHKDAAAKIFHDFFGTPAESSRRKQRGIYHAAVFGPVGKRVQVILLDTRYFRSPLTKADAPLPGFRARPYIPAEGQDQTMLGETQWKWLEEQLKQPAEVRILGSSIQVLSNEHPFEKWGTMPAEREKLFELIRRTGASGVVVVSGDRHLGEISVDSEAVGYPMYDITASGLNQATRNWRPVEPNAYRVAALPYGNHFGAIEIDWKVEPPVLRLQLRHEDGEIAIQSRVPLSELQAQPPELPLPEGISSPRQALALSEGTEVTVQFQVAGGRMLGNRARLLLNSQSDHRSPSNFTVVLNNAAMVGKFADVEAKTMMGKTIRAKGRITLYNSAKQLEVTSADQLEVVVEE
jgi:alkaline phosphatase D